MKEKIFFYLGKLNEDRESRFFNFFKVPTNPFIFTGLTLFIFILFEINTDLLFLPSLIGIYLLWKFHIILSKEYKIAKQCAIEESIMEDEMNNFTEELKSNYPEGPIYITEEDRHFILKNCLSYKIDLTIVQKIKSLLIIIGFYSIIYFICYFLF